MRPGCPLWQAQTIERRSSPRPLMSRPYEFAAALVIVLLQFDQDGSTQEIPRILSYCVCVPHSWQRPALIREITWVSCRARPSICIVAFTAYWLSSQLARHRMVAQVLLDLEILVRAPKPLLALSVKRTKHSTMRCRCLLCLHD